MADHEKGVPNRSLTERLQDTDLSRRALARAVRKALIEHKSAANPVAAWRDGQVVLIRPEDIIIPPEIPPEEDIEAQGDVTR